MKSKIGTIILGVAVLFVCSGFGIAEDGELLAFDKVYKNPQKAISGNKGNVVLPEASQEPAEQATANTVAKQTPHLVVMKELLKELPAEDRAEFLNSMVLINGRVVSMSLAPLRKTLTSEKVASVVKTIYYHPAGSDKNSHKNNESPMRFTEISKLLNDIPADVRNGFLDSLMFKDGSFVSAYIGGLRSAVKTARLDEIIKAIATTPGPIMELDPKAFCPGGVCYDAVCHGDDAGVRCIDDNNSSCDTSCHNYN